jgi:plastocyanin
MRRGKAVIVAALAIALVASACGVEGSPHLTIVARDYAFGNVPPVITGGPTSVTFRNEGQATHELAFLRIGNTPLEKFKKEFPAVFQGGPIPPYITAVAGAFEAEPGKSIDKTFTLAPGRYLLMCALQDKPGAQDDEMEDPNAPPHFNLGMTKWVDVEGESAELSAPDGTITAKDYTFEVPQLKGGENRLVFRNAGPKQFHFGDLQVYPAGTTEQQATDAFKTLIMGEENAPPPPGVPLPEEVSFSGIFSAGLGTTWDVRLESGRTYLLACFIQDREGGPPHAIKYGMYKAFTVG